MNAKMTKREKMTTGKKMTKALIFGCALLFCMAAFAPESAYAADIAVVDVARVIDASVPGKAGQRHIDNLKAELDAEMDKFMKSLGAAKDADARIAQKNAELGARYDAEFSRVTGLLLNELRRVTADWLKADKRGASVVLNASTTLATKPEADISADILRRLNTVLIDFTKK